MYHMDRRFGMDPDTRELWLPLGAGWIYALGSLQVAGTFVEAWGDFMRGPFGPPRPPLPGADSALGFMLLTMAIAWLPLVVPAALLRYTHCRDDADALGAWARAARFALVPAYLAMFGLLAYIRLRLRHV